MSPDGEVLDEISVPLALLSLPGVLPPKTEGFDITHLNDIEPVSAAAARVFPMLREGDLVISLRAHWAMNGPFRRQHDPDLLANGHLMVFDNLGGDRACGRSRILEIDPVTQDVVWSYDGCRGGRPFESEAWGEQQLLPNGNVLITESKAGRAIEVTREANSRIVWSYVNRIGVPDSPARGGVIGLAQRFSPKDLPFLDGRAVAEENGRSVTWTLPST